jgi:catalase
LKIRRSPGPTAARQSSSAPCLTKITDDQQAAQKTLLFLPGQPHPGVEPADPMLVLRNTAYPISLGERQ